MWTIKVMGYHPEETVQNGNRFLIGNGYMGYRGTLEEARADECVGLNLPGVYDQVGTKWRESVNAPNPLLTQVFVHDQLLHPKHIQPIEHHQALDLRTGTHLRSTTFEYANKQITLSSERFVSMARKHVLAMKYTVTVNEEVDLVIHTGIDHLIWDLNGPHLEAKTVKKEFNHLLFEARTQECKIPIFVGESIDGNFDVGTTCYIEDEHQCVREFHVQVKKDRPLTIYKYAYIHHGNHDARLILKELSALKALGYDELQKENQKVWDEKWRRSDVIIIGDDEAQLNLRYSIYHLLILTPRSPYASIPARGISGQTYKGAIFWDTEIFMLPFYLNTDIEAAKRLVYYRIHTLPGARRKAKEYGYRGAFYAWESQETGDDACSHFNVTDVFTKRPVRTYFRDKQIHISGAVVYALWQTYLRTKDIRLLLDGGLEVIMECARFYYSYAYYNHEYNRFEILDVTGPDEYHERVNNNAYTNRMVYETLQILERALTIVRESNPSTYHQLMDQLHFHEDLPKILDMRDRLYLPKPNHNNVIEQFDRYFTLEEVSLDEVRSRLVHPNEYWGGTNGVATHTQIIKQADVITMLYLFNEDYSTEIKKANWAYYEPRTEHGSSLSACMYALVACEIGNPNWAYPYFMKTASVDLTGQTKQFAGGIYIGGTHPAANGGAYMTAVYGFAGLQVQDDTISVNPRLPEGWDGMQFSLHLNGHWYRLSITQNGSQILKEE